LFNFLLIGYITLRKHGFTAPFFNLADGLLPGFLIDVGSHNFRSLIRKEQASGPSHPHSCASDKRNFMVKPHQL
jgi:hypothetical protein